MVSALIVTATEKSESQLRQLLAAYGLRSRVTCVRSGAEARRRLSTLTCGLVLINAPLSDESGVDLASFAAAHAGVVLLLARQEQAGLLADRLADDGVAVLAKPLDRALLSQQLRLLRAAARRAETLLEENRKLRRQLEDARLIFRAKCVLIECCGMTEPDAHAFLEKRAMNERQPLRDAARAILQAQEENNP